MVEIKKVETKKQQREFVRFPLKLYKDSEYYVPEFYSSEFNLFKDSYPYNKVCDVCFFLAYRDGKVVGRIQGIIQKEANKKWNQKQIRFTRFDCINDKEVSRALFDALVEYGKSYNLDELVGPLGYSDLEREGLLIEGFDQKQTFEEQYNYEYYKNLIEDYGLEKDVDWLEFSLRHPKEKDDRLLNISNKMMEKYNLRPVQEKSIKVFLQKYKKPLFELIDKTYSHLYGTVPLNDEIVESIVSDFLLLVRPSDIFVVLNENDDCVGFAIVFPSISEAVRKSKGHITLPFLVNFLKDKKHPKVMDMALIGISHEYESKGIPIYMIGMLLDNMEKLNIEHFETNLILEDNYHMLNMLKHFDKTQNKRRRCYKKNI